ncbi:MAG TPA: 5-formyltetrahydrofolate cyclo-ligase [Rudaea sp.]
MDLPSRRELRQRLRDARAALTPAQRIAAASALVAQLEQIPEFMVDARIAGYWAVGGELPLLAIFGGLLARAQRYHLPIVMTEGDLRFALWKPGGAVHPNRHGIPEPDHATADLVAGDALDVVLVPLLGFDRRGYRIGSGAGYYDRTFAFLQSAKARPAQPVLVGIGYSAQEVASVDPQPWDVRMDFIATERELIDCTVEADAG